MNPSLPAGNVPSQKPITVNTVNFHFRTVKPLKLIWRCLYWPKAGYCFAVDNSPLVGGLVAPRKNGNESENDSYTTQQGADYGTTFLPIR